MNQLTRLLDYAYKKGVVDASLVGDDFAIMEFLKRRKDPDTFGLLDTTYDISWREWRFIVTRWAFSNRMSSFAEKYLMVLTKPNYRMVPLVILQDFYTLGVWDWMENPNPMRIEVFKGRPHCHWGLVRGKALVRFTKEEKVSRTQEMIYDRIHRIEERGTVPWISRISYEAFSSEFWLLTRPIKPLEIDDY